MEFVDFVEEAEETKVTFLRGGEELCFQVPSGAKLTVIIKHGIVEILGTELATDIPYVFQGVVVTLFSFERSKIEWKCVEELEPKITNNDLYHSYIYNLHFALERMRLSSFNGPRVLIMGEESTGKSSLAHILCSYALKSKQYQPLLVNLNPQDGIFSMPSSLTATPISELLDVESSLWGQSITTGSNKLHPKQPIVKNFGVEHIRDNRPLYLDAISQLAETVEQRLKNDPLVRRSGVIVDTPPLQHLDSESWSDLEFIIEKFGISIIILCAENDDLALKANDLFRSKIDSIVRLPLPMSLVKSNDVMRRSMQRLQIREYFYGNSVTVLSPYTVGADFEELTVWKPRNSLEITDKDQEHNMLTLDKVEIKSTNLQHAILAITCASRKDTVENVSKSFVLGYALVTEVNDAKRKLRILLPLPSRIPDRAMILTEYRYLE